MNDTITAGAPVGNKNAAGHTHAKFHLQEHFQAKYTPKADWHTIAEVASHPISEHGKELKGYDGSKRRMIMIPGTEHTPTARASAPAASDVVRAAGTSEGARKGWEHRGVHVADGQLRWTSKFGSPMSEPIEQANQKASEVDKEYSRLKSKSKDEVHREFQEGERLDMSHAKGEPKENLISHIMEGKFHPRHIEHWASGSWKNKDSAKASSATEADIIHCRSHASAAGSVLAADKAWNAGEPVEFMWMPAGTHTICAGFRNGSIELTVNCDENTTAAVQASLEAWRAERPKQEPFGCIEHREHEASVRVSAQQAFSFKQDGDPGVYLAAEPTVLGAQNVNGKVHRSWSPSFTTDADYGAAKTIKTASGATVMVFPEGVRGSRSNPAEITGVDFCVGTLTNKPAFHAMSPVKSREGEAVQASGTSEGAKKGWASRVSGAHDLSNEANEESNKLSTMTGGQKLNHHFTAGNAHLQARAAHRKLAEDASNDGMHAQASYHQHLGEYHNMKWQQHMSDVDRLTKASDASKGDTLHAHCAHILLQDVPDATPAEIACYEKCLDDGGSHSTAVAEIRAQRQPSYVTQPAKAAEALSLDAIYAERQELATAAQGIAVEVLGEPLTAEDIYAEYAVTASGTSEGAKKGWENRAQSATDSAEHATKIANASGQPSDHHFAMKMHEAASLAHLEAGNPGTAQAHGISAMRHEYQFKQSSKKLKAKASEADDLSLESIYAHAGGNS